MYQLVPNRSVTKSSTQVILQGSNFVFYCVFFIHDYFLGNLTMFYGKSSVTIVIFYVFILLL